MIDGVGDDQPLPLIHVNNVVGAVGRAMQKRVARRVDEIVMASVADGIIRVSDRGVGERIRSAIGLPGTIVDEPG